MAKPSPSPRFLHGARLVNDLDPQSNQPAVAHQSARQHAGQQAHVDVAAADDRRDGLAGEALWKAQHERRWVVYNGDVEASRVPAEWHAWLHHTSDEVPPEGGIDRRPWMKEHKANATGTQEAYRPPGHTLQGGKRAASSSDYEAWTPD